MPNNLATLIGNGVVLVTPSADGSNGQVIQTDGNGNLSFTTVSGGGSPGGSDGQIQYNNSSAFGGASLLTYDDVNDRVGINDSSPDAMLDIVAAAATEVGLIVEAAASQTANLIEANSNGGSGGDLFQVDADGEVYATRETGLASSTPAHIFAKKTADVGNTHEVFEICIVSTGNAQNYHGPTLNFSFGDTGVSNHVLTTISGQRWNNTDHNARMQFAVRSGAGSFIQPLTIYHDGLFEFKNADQWLKMLDSDPGAYAESADDDAPDCWLRTSGGGAHTSNNPDGGDFNIALGAPGSGGSGVGGNFNVQDSANNPLLQVTYAGDVLLGTTTAPSAGSGNVLVMGDNGGDPTMGTNTAGIYGKDVAGTVEMFAVDEAGNATQLSPHDETGEWVFDSAKPQDRATGENPHGTVYAETGREVPRGLRRIDRGVRWLKTRSKSF